MPEGQIAESSVNIIKPREVRTGVSIDRNNNTSLLIEKAIEEGNGKIPYSEFMRLSLYGPEGYYVKAKASIGGKDFITSPEASEYFGATVGVSMKKVWEAMGSPQEFAIVEMGAGNGKMAKDILVWARKQEPEFYKALRYTIIEYGDLIEKQQETVTGKGKYKDINQQSTPEEHTQDLGKVNWIKGSASELPLRTDSIEGVFLSNELPDAFPVEVVKRFGDKILQKYVSLKDGEWVERWDQPSSEVQAYIEKHNYTSLLVKDTEEPVNLTAVKWQKEVDRALKRGAILTIDYGRNGLVEDKRERATRVYPPAKDLSAKTPPRDYLSPGDYDLTASVNFKVLEEAAREDGFSPVFSGTQEEFLQANGISEFARDTFDRMRQTKSWAEIVALSSNLKGYKKISTTLGQNNMGRFYAQMLTKGVVVDLNTGSHPPVFDTGIRLNLGKPNAKFNISIPGPQDSSLKNISHVTTDDQGYFSLDEFHLLPSEFESTSVTITPDRGDTLWGRTGGYWLEKRKKTQVSDSIQKSGYNLAA